MIFASPVFLVYFLPLVLLGYLIIPRAFKNIFLLLASIAFYSWGAPKFIFAILITTTIDFFLAKIIFSSEIQKKRKLALLLSLIMNVGFLFYFKYCNFFIENFNSLLSVFGIENISWTKIILPIGISFYTFESITYLVDVYRRVHKPLDNFWDYQLYILLFPKLIAGPITRYHDIADQMTGRFENAKSENIILGFTQFCIGLSKKAIIANAVGNYASAVYNLNVLDLNSSLAWMGSLAYTFQIYFDFAGYSDMAIGLAKMFDFNLPVNFDNPYTSSSITEFWRRWHMTLGSWMKNYLYIPLGGNKVNTTSRLYFNLFIVFVISGFWHGANWNFLLWGILHGLFLVIERMFLLDYLKKLPKLIGIVYTFFTVNFAWVLFNAQDLKIAARMYKHMFSFNFTAIPLNNDFIFYFILAAIFSFIGISSAGKKLQSYFYNYTSENKHLAFSTLIAFVLFTLSLASITGSGFNPFIYFRF